VTDHSEIEADIRPILSDPLAEPLEVVVDAAAGERGKRRGWRWRRPDPIGTIVIAHGFGEHCALYERVARVLGRSLNLDVLGIDFQGHGLSPGRRGAVGRFEDLEAELATVIDRVDQERPGRPVWLLGHSMGGLIALLAAERRPSTLTGLILSNPAFELSVPAPRWKQAVGRLLGAVTPGVTLRAPIPVEDLTGDPLARVRLQTDRLIHDRISAPLFFGMRRTAERLAERSAQFQVPLLMLIGAEDRVIAPSGCRRFFDQYGSADKTKLEFEGMGHHPLLERDRRRVDEGMAAWFDRRLESS